MAAVLAITAVLLLGAMSVSAAAAPTTPESHQAAIESAQPGPGSRPSAAVLPLVLGAIVILAAYNPVPRYHGGGRH
ncbi:MAG TPA: hypothetical protein VNK73_16695 [Actinomycetota bacterium]|jgi:hypothetical protein|nr:hypothetical protein [Actinomycetota bacterium]